MRLYYCSELSLIVITVWRRNCRFLWWLFSCSSCNLWATGRLFLRYRGLCVAHRYRGAGGYQATWHVEERRRLEDRALQKLEGSHAGLIKFQPKPKAGFCTMQCQMLRQGPEPLNINAATPVTGGRRFEAFADRAMTAAERQRRCRSGKRALSAS